MINITFSKTPGTMTAPTFALKAAGKSLPSSLQKIDDATKGYINDALICARSQDKFGSLLPFVVQMPDGMRQVIVVEMGPAAAVDSQALRHLGGKIALHMRDHQIPMAEMMIDAMVQLSLTPVDIAANLAMGVALGSYTLGQYKTDETCAGISELCFCMPEADSARAAYEPLGSIARGVHFARDLTNEPGNTLTPTTFAERCRALEELGLIVEVLDQAALQNLGMGALLGVAQGSEEPPRVVTLQWKNAEGAPAVLVGKGVTFDSGGLLPKGPEEMWDMKNDMAGAAAVVASLKSIAERGVAAHVVGIIGLVENMPSGHALRPGDIVRSMSGKTVEVLHTDAEGRLVLADLLTYAQQRFSPRVLIDIATLTGAMTAVLGQEYAGLFTNDDDLAGQLLRASIASGEKVWRLPLCDAFDRMIDSTIADVQNITKGRMAGSATAAQFLQRFVADVPWAHLDICGTAWRKDKDSFGITGATGYGVQLLSAYLDQNDQRLS